jgi:hypothetical protein
MTEHTILGKHRSMIETTATTSRHSTSPDNLVNGGIAMATIIVQEINQNLNDQPTPLACANSIKRFKTDNTTGLSEPKTCTEFNVLNEEESKKD